MAPLCRAATLQSPLAQLTSQGHRIARSIGITQRMGRITARSPADGRELRMGIAGIRAIADAPFAGTV
jgi:hypothetical protein